MRLRTRSSWGALAAIALLPVGPAVAQPISFGPATNIPVAAGAPGGVAMGAFLGAPAPEGRT